MEWFNIRIQDYGLKDLMRGNHKTFPLFLDNFFLFLARGFVNSIVLLHNTFTTKI